MVNWLIGELVNWEKKGKIPPAQGWVKRTKVTPTARGGGYIKRWKDDCPPPTTVFEYLADKTDLGSELVSIILET